MMDFAGRRDALRRLMAAEQCQALVITHLPDVQYLSGFSGSNAALLVLEDTQYLATDGRYAVQAGAEAGDVELVVTRALLAELLKKAEAAGVVSVGFDGARLSVEQWRRAGADVPGVALEPVGVDVAGLRRIKQPAEVAALREACAISTRALDNLLAELAVGMTELEIARRLELHMGLLGAADRAFDSIVASGPNSAVPHHQPTDRPLTAGDLLKIDFGAKYAGYHADCTRTFVVAADPADWQLEIHDVVARAQRAGSAALIPGCVGQEVDAIARAVIEDAGFGQYYGHGLGHGVGLEIHEAPFLGPNSTHTVEAGVPVTVEPGVYLPGRGGVRIEDTVIVHDDHVEVLTDFPRDLARVG